MFPVPFVLYADFESYLTSSGKHIPSGFCCLRVSKFPEHNHKIVTYSGDNVLQKFLEHIKNEQNTINKILSTNRPMNFLTDEKTKAHDAATTCLTCGNKFTTSNVKVRHHCHITGQYIVPICNKCNLQLKNRKYNDKYFIPLFMHNARSYDSHFIIKNFHEQKPKYRSYLLIPKSFWPSKLTAYYSLIVFSF